MNPYKDPAFIPRYHSPHGGLWIDLVHAPALLAGKRELGLVTDEEAALLQTFISDGFVVLEKAVDHALIDELNREVDRTGENPPPEAWVNNYEKFTAEELGDPSVGPEGRFHGVTRPMRKGDHLLAGTLCKLLDAYTFLPVARNVVFAPKTLRFLQLIFERPVLAHQSLFFFKGSGQDVHRDSAFVRISSPLEFAASWTALEDIQPGSGELVYYPGSHRVPEFLFEGSPWLHPESKSLPNYYVHLNAQCLHLEKKTFRPKKGDVLIWHANLAHGGGQIDDPAKTRRSIVAHYSPLNCYPMYRHYEGMSEIHQVGPGAYYCAIKKTPWRSA